ncbi:unnamed protein product [Thelazia callipaeda]|uniref:t-SNARE coiled-coil homology domain-containing protein n=1 Tax=Thelazia callipaeda TaxID=103827 RepID=A0A0N5D9L4_THECL|nr:unnamed protein product [Thelazia callipaeda]
MYDIVIVALVSFTHDRKIIGNDSLLRTIKTAKETLARVEQQEKDFYQLCGQCESDVLRNIILVQQREIYMKEKCLKRFDRCVDNVNNHLKVMEGEALAAISASCISETSTGTHNSSVKRNKDDKLADDSSPTTDLPVDVSQQIAEIGEELNKLEEQVDGIEIRVKDDLEAEQIDITFPITEIIDCMTALKVTMFKRHSLTKQLHNIVLSNNKFVEEAKIMKKGYAIWTKEEREDLLNKLALLEKSLAHLEQFPLIRNNEFSRYYPLTNDLAILKRTIVRFLDKFEVKMKSDFKTSTSMKQTCQHQCTINCLQNEIAA